MLHLVQKWSLDNKIWIIEDFTDSSTTEGQIQILYNTLSYAQQTHNIELIGLIEYHLIYRLDDLNHSVHALDLIESCKSHLQKVGAYHVS